MKTKDHGALHESFSRGDEKISGSSNKSFGLVFAAFFGILGLFPLLKGDSIRPKLLLIAVIFLLFALILPRTLTPLNYLWTKFGLLLHKVVNPVVMGILFYVVVTPIGQLMRLTGKDPMQRKWDPEAKTYWITRAQIDEQNSSMQNQF